MTYVHPDPKTTKGVIDFHLDIDSVETAINKAISQWLRKHRRPI